MAHTVQERQDRGVYRDDRCEQFYERRRRAHLRTSSGPTVRADHTVIDTGRHGLVDRDDQRREVLDYHQTKKARVPEEGCNFGRLLLAPDQQLRKLTNPARRGIAQPTR
jgi:hypothetical protein